jgi:hypothetical protein
VSINNLNASLAWALLAVLGFGFSSVQSSNEPARIKVLVEQVKRVSQGEVHFSLKVANGTGSPIFLPGTNFGRPTPHLVFLEQWQMKERWETVVPCIDTPPPDVIKLNPSGAVTLELDLNLKFPGLGVCKERNIKLEGMFRFRLDYFESEEQARTYLKRIASGGYQPAHGAVAVSEPFEMPPPQ